jgi:hypothetical protein
MDSFFTISKAIYIKHVNFCKILTHENNINLKENPLQT